MPRKKAVKKEIKIKKKLPPMTMAEKEIGRRHTKKEKETGRIILSKKEQKEYDRMKKAADADPEHVKLRERIRAANAKLK